VFRDGGAGLFGQAAAHRGGIEDDGGAFAFAELDQAEGVFDGVQVGGGGAAGHENEIGDVQGVAGRHVRTAGGVDEDQVGVLRSGLLDQGRELRGRGFDHRGRSGAAALAPFVGGCLRVDIEEGDALAMALGADGQMRGKGAFSGTPLLADQGDGFHGLILFHHSGMMVSISFRMPCQTGSLLVDLQVVGACEHPPLCLLFHFVERKRVKGL